MKKLENISDREYRFCLAYARHSIGAKACREAGYKGGAEDLSTRAFELLRKPYIQDQLNQVKEQYKHDAELEAYQVIEQYKRLAYFDIMDYIREDGQVDLDKLKQEDSTAIKEIRIDEREIPREDAEPLIQRKINIKAHDKIKALEGLERIFVFSKDHSEQVIKIVGPEDG